MNLMFDLKMKILSEHFRVEIWSKFLPRISFLIQATQALYLSHLGKFIKTRIPFGLLNLLCKTFLINFTTFFVSNLLRPKVKQTTSVHSLIDEKIFINLITLRVSVFWGMLSIQGICLGKLLRFQTAKEDKK